MVEKPKPPQVMPEGALELRTCYPGEDKPSEVSVI